MATIDPQTEVLEALQRVLPTDSARLVFVCVRLVVEVPLSTWVAPLQSDSLPNLTAHPPYCINPSDHAASAQALILNDSLHFRASLVGFGRSHADSSVRRA